MNRIDRLSAILIQLQSKRIVKAQEIAERFSISIRTVYRDIRALESAGIPIGSEAGVGYFLAQGYHLPPVMFTAREAFALITAGKLAEKFSDDDIKTNYCSALYKIKAVLKSQEKDNLEQLEERIAVYSFSEERSAAAGSIADIQAALCGKKILRIEYSSAGVEASYRMIEPISLGFYENYWYLIAFCRLRNEYRIFRLDRIKKLDVTAETFDDKHCLPVDKLWAQMLGKKHLQKVIIQFKKNVQYDIIKNKCISGFVEEKDLGGKIELTLLVDSLEVLAKWLLPFLDDAEIAGPEELIHIMSEYASVIAEKYLNASFE